MQHNLKINPEYYQLLEAGKKTAELRKNDRNFKVNDLIHLHEYEIGLGYTQKPCISFAVTHVLEAFEGLLPNYVLLSIKRLK